MTATATAADMVLVPAGRFLMGGVDGSAAERPPHYRDVAAFLMDRTPVTNAEFGEFVDATGHVTTAERVGAGWGYAGGDYAALPGVNWRTYATPDRDDHPVVLVSWEDAAAFAAWAGKRLPTEAEWEYAAGAGMGEPYPWGAAEPDGSQCPFARSPSEVPPTDPVGRFPANRMGLHDLVGHVWQLCADWYSADTYAAGRPPEAGTHRVRRGGAWNVIQPFRLRTTNRGAFAPDQAAVNVGFRCAADL